MKKSLFAAIFAIAAMVLSSLATPCRAQVINPERMEVFEKNNVLPVAEQMPEWKPGMDKGKKVNVLFALTISFKLR